MKALKDKLVKSGGMIQLLTGDDKERGTTLGNVMMGLLATAVTKVQASVDRREQVYRNLQIAFALAAYQRDNTRYPDSLDALTPKYLAKIPNDLFTDKPLIYRKTDSGYSLYSFGPDGKDDEGRGNDDDPKGDDIGVRMPLPKLND